MNIDNLFRNFFAVWIVMAIFSVLTGLALLAGVAWVVVKVLQHTGIL